MKATRLAVLLASACSLAAAGLGAAQRTGPVLRSEQAMMARSLEEKAADQCWTGDLVRAMKEYQRRPDRMACPR